MENPGNYHTHVERRRRQLLRGLIVLMASVAVAHAAFNLLYTGFYATAAGELASLAVLVSLYRAVRRSGDIARVARLVFGLMFGATLVLVIASQGRNFNFIWLLGTPLLALFLFGRREGLRLALAGMLFILSLLIYGWHYWPAPVFGPMALLNVLGSLIALTLVGIYFETTRSEAEQAVLALALTDPLAGVWNRRYFTERSTREVSRARRHELSLSLILLDIDGFKAINDSHGHIAGDAVIRHLATALEARVRAADVIARVGGDEFGVLLPHTALAQGRIVAESLRRTIENCEVACADLAVRYTISLGVAELGPEMGYLDLYQAADAALYRAKNSGRNRAAAAPLLPEIGPDSRDLAANQ